MLVQKENGAKQYTFAISLTKRKPGKRGEGGEEGHLL